MKNDRIKQIHKMYEEGKKLVEASMGNINELSEIENMSEREFYIAMRDFFMQQKQKELIKKGIF